MPTAMDNLKNERRKATAHMTPGRTHTQRTEVASIVKEAIGVQAKFGTMCAVEMLRAAGLPAEIITRVLQNGGYREADQP